MIHRLIWEIHNGLIPAGHVIHHIDRDRLNNSIENLICMESGIHTRLHVSKPLTTEDVFDIEYQQYLNDKKRQYKKELKADRKNGIVRVDQYARKDRLSRRKNMAKVKVEKLKCQKCGHEWVPRSDDVRQCPGCHTVWWDEPKEDRLEGEAKEG